MKKFKEEKKKNVTICLSSIAIEKAKEFAERENRSMSAAIENLILEAKKNLSFNDPLYKAFRNCTPFPGNIFGEPNDDFKEKKGNSISDWDFSKCRKMVMVEDLSIEKAKEAFKKKQIIESPFGLYVIIDSEGNFE
jgi:hypothetical protein